MRAHYLQHVPFEGLGSIEAWLQEAGFTISSTGFFAKEQLPAVEAIDFLVIMGGPMSVNDEVELPWLVAEIAFIRAVIDAGKPVLGICLGAQLIASALGAKVYPNSKKEIGWLPVTCVPANVPGVFQFPATSTVFHWHGETFDLPEGAVHLARSAGCEHQAFQWGSSVLGLQFHLETTPESARAIIAACGDELVPDEFVHSADMLLAAPDKNYRDANGLMAQVLAFLCRNHSR
jgi:GMP synthase-like glutamine amidotransferase